MSCLCCGAQIHTFNSLKYYHAFTLLFIFQNVNFHKHSAAEACQTDVSPRDLSVDRGWKFCCRFVFLPHINFSTGCVVLKDAIAQMANMEIQRFQCCSSVSLHLSVTDYHVLPITFFKTVFFDIFTINIEIF